MRFLLILASSLSLIAGAAVAQTETPGGHRAHMRAHSQGTKISLDRGAGQGRIEIECAPGETTRACVEAVLAVIDALPPDGASGGGAPGSGVAYATTSIKCGSTVYEVSTGTSGGNCSVAGIEGEQRNSTGCNDGGNKASANCQTGCGASSGSGSCTIKSVP